jgi:outer membrane protein TolC
MRSHIILLLTALALPQMAFTQTANPVTLQQCFDWAAGAYPLNDRPQMLEQAAQLRSAQIKSDRLPQLEARIQAGWQTEITDFPFELPPPIGDPLDLPLYRAQATVQASWLVYDGGLGKARLAQEQSNLAAEQQGIAVEMNKLKEIVNQYFFGILLLQGKQRVLATSLQNLTAQKDRIDVGIRNGVVLPSAADQMEVEMLKIQAQITETGLTEKGLRQQLADLTGRQEEEFRLLELPQFEETTYPLPLNRPEFTAIELQKVSVDQRNELLSASRRPKLSAFATGGIGYPNPLNLFDESLAPFAQVGLQAQWTIYDWGKLKRDRELLGVQQLILDNQATVLETNLNRADAAFLQQMESLLQLMESDRQIAELQARLLKTLALQLEQGVATPTDYLLQSNAETLARMQLKTHEIQLAQTRAGYGVHRGSIE